MTSSSSAPWLSWPPSRVQNHSGGTVPEPDDLLRLTSPSILYSLSSFRIHQPVISPNLWPSAHSTTHLRVAGRTLNIPAPRHSSLPCDPFWCLKDRYNNRKGHPLMGGSAPLLKSAANAAFKVGAAGGGAAALRRGALLKRASGAADPPPTLATN